jgi:hypothetical protein
MAAKKASSKKDLETKIAELEAKLSKLAAQLEAPATKPAEVKPAEVKPAEVKPAEVKPAETKPAEVPKPAETAPPAPVTFQAALEDAYYNAPQTSFHDYRAKVTGYSPAPNRYFVRLHAPVGTVPTSNWNDQKAKVTGYTQPSNQYFATKQRMAYSPPGKTFGSFSGVTMSVEGVQIQEQAPPAEVPKPKDGKLPKETVQAQHNEGKSKKQSLDEYESDYMQRMADQQGEQDELMRAAAELRAQRQTESQSSSSPSKKGALPKGF